MATIQCTGCGKRIIQKGDKCPHCDTPINGVKEAPKPNKNLTSCPACSEPISKNATSCPHCGEPLSKEMQPKKKTSAWTWLVLLLFVSWAVSKVGNTNDTSISTDKTTTKTHKPKKERRKTLKGGYYACTTESKFDEIISAVVAKDNLAIGHLLSHGCVLTKSGVRVSIIDFGFGTSKVRAYTGDEAIIIYTNTENIYY